MRATPVVSRPGLLFLLIGIAGLFLPLVLFKPNRIVPGEGMRLWDALPAGWLIAALLAAILIAGCHAGWPAWMRLVGSLGGLLAIILSLGHAATQLTPPDDTLARIAPASGFWLVLLAFGLMLADAVNRARPSLRMRWLLIGAAIVLGTCVLASGMMDDVSVMREYTARRDLFWQQAGRHLTLAFGSLALALVIGLPLGVLIYQSRSLRQPVLGVLNILQTIPSLALFGVMIPLFGWIAVNVPGAAQAGIAGIGLFPALIALFLYSLLPVVANTLSGLQGVDNTARDAAIGLGMTRSQVLVQVLMPLALPVLLAAVRIALVQNIGMAVIAGLIGGGGFGTFVFQGLTQTAMDLVLLGTLPTVALALVAGIVLDLMVQSTRQKAGSR